MEYSQLRHKYSGLICDFRVRRRRREWELTKQGWGEEATARNSAASGDRIGAFLRRLGSR